MFVRHECGKWQRVQLNTRECRRVQERAKENGGGIISENGNEDIWVILGYRESHLIGQRVARVTAE